MAKAERRTPVSEVGVRSVRLDLGLLRCEADVNGVTHLGNAS